MNLKTQIKTKEELLDTLENYNIFCIASREDDDELKYYFYGKRKGIKQYDLMEINVYDKKEIELLIKCEQEGVGEEIISYIKHILKSKGYV